MNSILFISYILSIVVASYSQVLLKKGANKKNIFINKFTIIGYSLMIISTVLSLIGYKVVDMSLSQLLQILGFFFVALFSYLFLKEKITKKTVISFIIVLIGIIVYSL